MNKQVLQMGVTRFYLVLCYFARDRQSLNDVFVDISKNF